MKAICTICSKRKDESEDLLPARSRYLAEHIQATEKIAKDLKLPLYIISGKYGLVSGDEMIPNYDYYLEMGAVEELSKIIAEQLKATNITELVFYTEVKPTWAPYELALRKACGSADTTLAVLQL